MLKSMLSLMVDLCLRNWDHAEVIAKTDSGFLSCCSPTEVTLKTDGRSVP